jgi:hypothetical protein
MKQRVHRKGVLLALAVLLVPVIHLAVLHAAVSVREIASTRWRWSS